MMKRIDTINELFEVQNLLDEDLFTETMIRMFSDGHYYVAISAGVIEAMAIGFSIEPCNYLCWKWWVAPAAKAKESWLMSELELELRKDGFERLCWETSRITRSHDRFMKKLGLKKARLTYEKNLMEV